MKLLFDSVFKIACIHWQRVLEDSRIMKGYLNKVILLIYDGFTKEVCIAAFLFSKSVRVLLG